MAAPGPRQRPGARARIDARSAEPIWSAHDAALARAPVTPSCRARRSARPDHRRLRHGSRARPECQRDRRPRQLARPDRAAGAGAGADNVAEQLAGPWRRSPILLDDGPIAIISDACAAAARDTFGETEATLPTALVDARGEHFATAILADDLNAIVCLVRLDDAAAVATVDSVDRLSMTAVAPVDGTKLSVASLVRVDDRPGGRTIAIGRIGLEAELAKVGFDDNSVILASDAEGWWAMWWQGSVRATSYAAVDKADLVVGNAQPFDGEREARVGPAAWWVDPTTTPLATATTIRALVREAACAGGKTPENRVEPPQIDVTNAAITIAFEVRLRPGVQDCQGNPPFPVTIKLPEPLGNRPLLDGGSDPPRNAMSPPAG